MSKTQTARPISPHVGIYRWQFTNTLSILHRITGFGLTLGLIPLTLWLWGLAYSPSLYGTLLGYSSTLVGKLFLTGWMTAFYYHLANGIRHLNWDMGKGFSLPEAKASARLVVVFAVAMTIFTWVIISKKIGGIV